MAPIPSTSSLHQRPLPFLIWLLFTALIALTGCDTEATLKLRKQVRHLRNQVEALTGENQRVLEQTNSLRQELKRTQHKLLQTERAQKELQIASEKQQTALSQKLGLIGAERDALIVKVSSLEKKLSEAKASDTKDNAEVAIIHYYRPDGDYTRWGVHAAGPAPLNATEWAKPRRFKERDDYGGIAKIKLHADHKKYPLEIMIHNGLGDRDCVDANQGDSPAGSYSAKVDVSENKQVWLVSGLGQTYRTLEEARAAILTLSSH